jgi:hypothetical protein
MENTAQLETAKRYTHVYLGREDGDYDYLLTLSEDRREFIRNIVRALELDGSEEVRVVESDFEPVDVLCFHNADSIAERIPA